LQSIEAHYAIPATGSAIVSFNPWLSSAQIERQIAHVRPKALLADGSFIKSHRELFLSQASHPIVILDEALGASEFGDRFACFQHDQYAYDSSVRLDRDVVSELDPIALNFTSGTTSEPKCVVYSHRAAYLHAIGQVLMMNMTASSVYYWSLPMFHVNGWGHMWAAVAAGAKQVVDETVTECDAITFRGRLTAAGATHLAGAPRLLRKLTESAASRPGQGLTAMTGGAAPTADLVRSMKLQGVNLIHQYGLNETCGPFVVCDVKSAWSELPLDEQVKMGMRQGVAALHAGVGLRVVDVQMQDVPWDGVTQGEVLMAGNTVAQGYFENPQATAEVFRDGWFHSGDVAVVHPDGYLEIKDRLKDLIFVETPYGWENVSTLEIENAAAQTPGVRDAAVVGMREPGRPAEIVLFYETSASDVVDECAIRDNCRERLPDFKVPAHYIRASIPKTATGKVMKHVLLEEAKSWLKGRSAEID
jgi:fatty-acyl-CoA synthase